MYQVFIIYQEFTIYHELAIFQKFAMYQEFVMYQKFAMYQEFAMYQKFAMYQEFAMYNGLPGIIQGGRNNDEKELESSLRGACSDQPDGFLRGYIYNICSCQP